MLKKTFYLLVTTLFIFYALAAHSGRQPKRNLIIDTDVAIDDVIAILYLIQQPNITIKAIIIEGDGNAHCQPAYANIQGLLKLTHHEHIPAACGRSTPLQGHHAFTNEVLHECDTLNGAGFSGQTSPLQRTSAKELMSLTLKNSKEPMEILSIAPLTTLAEVIHAHPELKSKIHMIYMMGGAINVSGNIKAVNPLIKNEVAEWNIYIDPYAAHQVFHSGIPITLIPLDATNQAPVEKEFINRIRKNDVTPVEKYMNHVIQVYQSEFLSGNWYFWDALAAVILTDESIAKIKTEKLLVQLTPEEKSGGMIKNMKDGEKIRACTSINKMKFENRLINGLTQ